AGVPRAAFTAGRGRAPTDASSEPIAEWVSVRSGGRRLAARVIEGRGDYRMTAAATVVFGEALAELRAAEQRAGAFAPEELFSLARLWPALERRGFRILERPVI